MAEGPLAHLEGTWRGTGRGSYPTIEPFTYDETVTFTALPGKPVLAYTQRTTSAGGAPMHTEVGYLRPVGTQGVEFVVAQPTGVTETHDGVAGYEPDGAWAVTFTSLQVGLTPNAKEVVSVWRALRVRGDTLTYELSMAAVGQPLTPHLWATLQRIKD